MSISKLKKPGRSSVTALCIGGRIPDEAKVANLRSVSKEALEEAFIALDIDPVHSKHRGTSHFNPVAVNAHFTQFELISLRQHLQI